jgi:hypothetical protein
VCALTASECDPDGKWTPNERLPQSFGLPVAFIAIRTLLGTQSGVSSELLKRGRPKVGVKMFAINCHGVIDL